MSAAIRIGRKRANDGLALHLSIDGRTCRTDRRINVKAETLSTKAKRCKSCFTEARIALAQTENNASDSRWDADVDKFLAAIGPQSTLNPAGYNPEHDEERAEIARRWAEDDAPVEVEVPELSKLGQFADDLGVVPNASQPHRVTRKSPKRRLALANSFCIAA